MAVQAAHVDGQISILADNSPGPFEGPEKLLELWFSPSEQHIADMGLTAMKSGGRGNHPNWTGLRQVERSVWDSMLDEVQCKVLSVIEGEEVDAYLLSESSMFVWPHKLILKTCGTTTLLLGLPTLLRIASEICGFKGVWRCFYSRKTFMFPDRQRGPHKDWAQEMEFLDQLFENSSAYTVGRMNGDHWLLYLTPPQDDVLQPYVLASSSSMKPSHPSTPLDQLSASLSSSLPRTHSFLPHHPVPKPLVPKTRPIPTRPDQTLEILMSRLSPRACASFYHPSSSSKTPYTTPLYPSDPNHQDAHTLGSQLSDRLGLSALLPQATMDSFLFSPCGYSSNAIQGDRYATIHVTPEPDYSYASFESNLEFIGGGGRGRGRGDHTSSSSSLSSSSSSSSSSSKLLLEGGPRNLQELVERVLDVFEPAKMSITLFVSMDDESEGSESDADEGEEEEEENDREDDAEREVGEVERRKKRASGGGRVKAHEGMRELLNPNLLAKYERVDRILYEFDGYSLVYAVFQAKEDALGVRQLNKAGKAVNGKGKTL